MITAYSDADMPLETIWLFDNYMKDGRNFEIDKTKFPDLGTLVSNVRFNNQRVIPVVSTAVN